MKEINKSKVDNLMDKICEVDKNIKSYHEELQETEELEKTITIRNQRRQLKNNINLSISKLIRLERALLKIVKPK